MPILIKGSGGKNPSGTRNISSNGTYDVADYASAKVAVPATEQATPVISVSSSGQITATAGGKSATPVQLSSAHDSDFKASNIKSGVTIFGLAGTCAPKVSKALPSISTTSQTVVVNLSSLGVTSGTVIYCLAMSLFVYVPNVGGSIEVPFIYSENVNAASWGGSGVSVSRSGANLQFEVPTFYEVESKCEAEYSCLVTD